MQQENVQCEEHGRRCSEFLEGFFQRWTALTVSERFFRCPSRLTRTSGIFYFHFHSLCTFCTYGLACMMHANTPPLSQTHRLLLVATHLPIWLPVSAGKSLELNNEAAGRQPVSREKRRK